MAADFLLYGATGYTGALIARMAVERGLRPILVGRNRAKLAALAGSIGGEYRVAGLNDPQGLSQALSGGGTAELRRAIRKAWLPDPTSCRQQTNKRKDAILRGSRTTSRLPHGSSTAHRAAEASATDVRAKQLCCFAPTSHRPPLRRRGERDAPQNPSHRPGQTKAGMQPGKPSSIPAPE